MYLQELKAEQKELFLDLSILLSSSDSNFSVEEKNLIKQICAEMQIEERYASTFEFKDVIDKLVDISTKKEKRIMLIELAGIIMVDGEYTDEENRFINDIAEKFSIPYDEVNKMILKVTELYGVYKKFSMFLNGESI